MSAWVFVDLDGTLTDSAPGITAAIRHALRGVGAPEPGEAALRACIGPSLQESFPRLGVPEAEASRALALYREHYNDGGIFDARVYDGAHDMLAAFRAMGFRLALATAKPIAYAPKVTRHFGLADLLDAEFGSELDGRGTDKRDLLAHCLAETGADPARSFMLGDRLHDARGARHNGVAAIGALWGFGAREELEAAGVAALAHVPAEVPAIVERLR
ncbi:MAG: HAD hydrolase-like protein [Pikeienuella sp.]|uniref:HAD hydrolase-like protein n=1 Tax=Pikeienuella sp. TaxID=2831957 RepID=UPI00391ADD84